MFPTVAALWALELRSDRYRQCNDGRLRSEDNRYCMFGVLCDLYIKETEAGKWVFDAVNREWVFYGIIDKSKVGLPPMEVMQWAGLHGSTYNGVPLTAYLLMKHDQERWSFTQMAEFLAHYSTTDYRYV